MTWRIPLSDPRTGLGLAGPKCRAPDGDAVADALGLVLFLVAASAGLAFVGSPRLSTAAGTLAACLARAALGRARRAVPPNFLCIWAASRGVIVGLPASAVLTIPALGFSFLNLSKYFVTSGSEEVTA